jgi:hypothetical protein
MVSNTKLMFEELMKEIQSMRFEMREGFAMHEVIFAAHDAKYALAEQQREKRVATLEATVVEFAESLGEWKPEVDSSLSSVKLELSKLHSFFDRDTKAMNSTKYGVLPVE